MSSITINIGGEGAEIMSQLTLKGCECRHDDFVMALVKFANEWKNSADTTKPIASSTNPCGCKDAK